MLCFIKYYKLDSLWQVLLFWKQFTCRISKSRCKISRKYLQHHIDTGIDICRNLRLGSGEEWEVFCRHLTRAGRVMPAFDFAFLAFVCYFKCRSESHLLKISCCMSILYCCTIFDIRFESSYSVYYDKSSYLILDSNLAIIWNHSYLKYRIITSSNYYKRSRFNVIKNT